MSAVETDDQIIERLKVRFELLEDMTTACKDGNIRAMIVKGAPGVGKSFGVEKVLSHYETFSILAENSALKKFDIVKGEVSALGLYCKLYYYRHAKNVVVLDDSDSIFSDESALNIAKTATDTSKRRMIHWNTDSTKLRKEGIPSSFEFKGSVIFITNVNFDNRSAKFKDHLTALESRSHFVDLTINTAREKLLRIRYLVDEGMLNDYNLDERSVEDIIDFIHEHKDSLRELSLRTVIKMADLRVSFPDKWKAHAKVTLMH